MEASFVAVNLALPSLAMAMIAMVSFNVYNISELMLGRIFEDSCDVCVSLSVFVVLVHPGALHI